MEAHLATLDASLASKEGAKDEHLPTGEAVDVLMGEAKAWRRAALVTIRVTPATARSLPSGVSGSSYAELEKSIKAVLPVVAKAP